MRIGGVYFGFDLSNARRNVETRIAFGRADALDDVRQCLFEHHRNQCVSVMNSCLLVGKRDPDAACCLSVSLP